MIKFMKYISKIHRCANLYKTGKYEGTDIGNYEDTYILNVCNNPGVSQDALAKIICVHKSNVTRHMAALEAKGYVRRVADEKDKRSVLVYPTDKAIQARGEIRGVIAEWNKLLLDEFDEKEREVIAAYAKRLAERAEQIIKGE